jgi:hypothetical protein
MGLISLISLKGTAKSRSTAVICGIVGLIAQIGCVILMVLSYGGNLTSVPFDALIKLFQVGYYMSLAGFLWMMISPSFAPKTR